jgi:prefoldin subunit 5
MTATERGWGAVMTGGLGPTPERRNPSVLPDYDDDLSPLLELSAQVREALARIVPARQRAQQQIKPLAQRQEEFEYDAREACDLGDDDLARHLLAKKQYLTNLIAELTSQQHSLEDEEREFTQMQQRLQVRYEVPAPDFSLILILGQVYYLLLCPPHP